MREDSHQANILDRDLTLTRNKAEQRCKYDDMLKLKHSEIQRTIFYVRTFVGQMIITIATFGEVLTQEIYDICWVELLSELF